MSEELTTTTQAEHIPTVNERDWALVQRKAKALMSAHILPKEYRDNMGSCLIALDMSERTGAPPLMVMQNLHVIQGRPSFSASFLIGAINSCGRFTSIRYEERGEIGSKDYALRAVSTEKATGEVLAGTWISAAMVEGEGWMKKPGSKWLTMPEQMYRYRASAFWVRAYAPEIALGLHTVDELEDIGAAKAPPPGTMTVRLSPKQMQEAKHEVEVMGKSSADEIIERMPNLPADQKAEIATWVFKGDPA